MDLAQEEHAYALLYTVQVPLKSQESGTRLVVDDLPLKAQAASPRSPPDTNICPLPAIGDQQQKRGSEKLGVA